MKIKSEQKMQNVVINSISNKNFVFIYLNEKAITEENENGIYKGFEYDYNEFEADASMLQDIQANPHKYLNYKKPQELTTDEKVAKLEQDNQMLTECVLEMSTMIYQ